MKASVKIVTCLVLFLALASFASADCTFCNETCTPCSAGPAGLCTATNLNSMYVGVTDFNNVVGDITGWNTSCITSMTRAFKQSDFNQDINNWDVSNVAPGGFYLMFENNYDFNQNINSWDVSRQTSTGYMFYTAFAFNGNISSWNTENITSMAYMFYAANDFAQDISSWNTSKVTDMQWMFDSNYNFNAPIGNWDVSKVTTFQNMMGDAESFNQNLTSWDTSSATDMSIMFANAFRPTFAFNGDISGFNTSGVTDMHNMFWRSFSFNQPIGNWDVHNVANMHRMFYIATSFNQELNSWDTESVTDMGGMFEGATAFNQNLSAWNTGKVGDMSAMFKDAIAFNYFADLGNWNTGNVTTMTNIFSGVTVPQTDYDAILAGWGSKPQQSGVTLDVGSTKYSSAGATGRSALIGFGWTINDGGLLCTNNSDCGLCEYCNAGTCTNQNFGDDLKGECPGGFCDGTGVCSVDMSGYTFAIFTSNGTFNWSGDPINVTILVVAGGAGGGCGGAGAGAGGAGGLIYEENYLVTGNTPVTVGDGGAGVSCTDYNDITGYNGMGSSFGNISTNGGGGGSSGNLNGADGGSGGGADGGYTGTLGGIGVPGQGYDGGQGEYMYGTCSDTYAGGGGGGAGGIGGHAEISDSKCRGGAGGIGFTTNFTGVNVCYAGGGGGGNWRSSSTSVGGNATCGGGAGGADTSPGENGTANTGGGGGGAGGGYSSGPTTGGNGGSGIVIVRYPTPEETPTTCYYPDLVLADYSNDTIYSSCDNGTSWTELLTGVNVNYGLFLNKNGSKIVVAPYDGNIRVSDDGGQIFTEISDTNHVWENIKGNSDGSVLVVTGDDGMVFRSDDGGYTWSSILNLSLGGGQYSLSLALSEDGQKIITGVASGFLYISNDGGSTWSELFNDTARFWWGAVDMDYTGNFIVVATEDDPAYVYVSTDGGISFHEALNNTESVYFEYAKVSADGKILISGWPAMYNGKIFYSEDYGATWNVADVNDTISGVTANKDFSLKYAVSYRDVAGRLYKSINGSDWNFTESFSGSSLTAIKYRQEYEPLECINDYDCGACMKCSMGSCTAQAAFEDIKNDCDITFTSCLNDYTRQGGNGYCDGAGSCDATSGTANISEGNVCINGTDANPTSTNNCGIWKACEEFRTSADEYYVGYTDDGTGNCIDTGWQSKGTYWSTPLLYMIAATENTSTCSIMLIGGNHAPEITMNLSPSAPTIDDTVRCSYSVSDLDNDTTNSTLSWYVNDIRSKKVTGAVIDTSQAITFNDSTTLSLHAGDKLTCEIVSYDGIDTSSNNMNVTLLVKTFSFTGGGGTETRAVTAENATEVIQEVPIANVTDPLAALRKAIRIDTLNKCFTEGCDAKTEAIPSMIVLAVVGVVGYMAYSAIAGKGAVASRARKKKRF